MTSAQSVTTGIYEEWFIGCIGSLNFDPCLGCDGISKGLSVNVPLLTFKKFAVLSQKSTGGEL